MSAPYSASKAPFAPRNDPHSPAEIRGASLSLSKPVRSRPWVRLAAVFLLALAIRGVAATRVALIERDGLEYLSEAAKLARGDVRGAIKSHYPPAYPAAVAVLARATGVRGVATPEGEAVGLAVSALAGAALASLVAGAAFLAHGRRAAWLAGLLAAVHPSGVEQSVKVTADALFSALVLGAIAAATSAFAATARWPRLRLAVAGGLAAASYLARPEGILVLGALVLATLRVPRRSPGPSRVTAPLWVLLPGAVVAAGYVVAIKPEAVMTGRDAGVWKLTKKRELFLESGGERVFPRGADGARHLDVSGARAVAGVTLERAVKQVGLSWTDGGFALALALFGAFYVTGARARDPGRPECRAILGATTGTAAVLLLTAYALIRTDTRYGAILFLVVSPYAGRGLAIALDLARAALVATPRGMKTPLVVFLIVELLIATRPRLERKREWREAADHCRARGVETVAATDPRVAFYGGARLVDLVPVRSDPAAIVSLSRTLGAAAVVVGDTHPDEAAVVEELTRTLGEPLRFEGEGRETVALYWVEPR